jgi:hypothetical protein
MDMYIRRYINKKLGGLKLMKNIFYMRCTDGRLGFMKLYEKYFVHKIATLGHLVNSKIGHVLQHYLNFAATE